MSRKNSGPLDLFGEVPVTKADVYAWLLSVVDLDPASERAAGYVRSYSVIQKITQTKLEGTFDALTEKARNSARYMELLTEGPTHATAGNSAGVGEWISVLSMPTKPMRKRAPYRPRDVIKKQRKRERQAKNARKQLDMSMLRRLPQSMPALSIMLQDIGNPNTQQLAAAFKVHVRSVQRWISEDKAPQAVLMAIFWITRWGASAADANAHNDAVMSTVLANSREAEVTMLQAQIAHVERLADFGSANDPLPTVKARPPARQPTNPALAAHVEALSKPEVSEPMPRAMRR